MAGHRYGELASAIAVNTMRRFYLSKELDRLLSAQFKRAKQAGLEARTVSYEQFKLKRSVEEANLAIFNTSRRNPQYETMGTTLVALLLAGKQAYLAHVGDSRIYRMRGSSLQQVTEDHSLLNEYIRMNLVKKEDAATFPMKNVIVRALGLSETVDVEVARRSCRGGDMFLLCSDGLSDMVTETSIGETLSGVPDCAARVDALIHSALNAGGVDNVTALVVDVQEDAEGDSEGAVA
jgi:protein phosphatase